MVSKQLCTVQGQQCSRNLGVELGEGQRRWGQNVSISSQLLLLLAAEPVTIDLSFALCLSFLTGTMEAIMARISVGCCED